MKDKLNIPHKIFKHLCSIAEIVLPNNPEYFLDKLKFVQILYLECETAKDVEEKIDHYLAYRILVHERALIDKEFLPKEIIDALYDKYDSVLETIQL